MSERERIEERLRRKEAEMLGLEEKLKSTRVYVQALRDVLSMLDVPASEPVTAEETEESVLRPGSAVALARDVILRRGEPMHVNDILLAMGRESTRETQASLIGSISAYVRRDKIFTRPAPNTFGLAELDHTRPNNGDVRPPLGFGRIKPGIDSDDDLPF